MHGLTASAFRPITSPVKSCIVLKNLALSVTQSSQVGFSFPLALLVFIKKKKKKNQRKECKYVCRERKTFFKCCQDKSSSCFSKLSKTTRGSDAAIGM